MSSALVHVAVFDGYGDREVGYATAHLRRPPAEPSPGRYEIVMIGLSRNPVITMGGLRVVSDIALDELSTQDSVMLILPGGDSWELTYPQAHPWYPAKKQR